jgi:hypothetical protein
MGGQACVLYGAAEFSRDTDLLILADAGNLKRLRQALAELGAEVIAVPPRPAGPGFSCQTDGWVVDNGFEASGHGKGLGCRCHAPEIA